MDNLMGIVENLMWLVSAASLLGQVLNIQRKRSSYIIWLCANVAWIAYDLAIHSYAQAALFFAYAITCVWGIIQWGKPQAAKKEG